METVKEATEIIANELRSDDAEVRSDYLEQFDTELKVFERLMGEAFVRWRNLDENSHTRERQAWVSATLFNAFTLNLMSMKLLTSGYLVASGNLMRQVVEMLATAILCASSEFRRQPQT